MKYDYKKLTEDLRRAKQAGVIAAQGEDGGSANLDCITLGLPGAIEKKVIEAVDAAGLHTSGKTKWIGTRYFLSSPGRQGNSRVRANEAMKKVLEEAGYDVLIFNKMD
jgi:hypothetical protein